MNYFVHYSYALGGLKTTKKAILFTTIIIICTLLSMPLVNGDYQVSIGETFTYTVNNSYWNMQLGSNSCTVSSCQLFSESVSVGTSFDVEVTNVSQSIEVCWNLTLGTNIYSSHNSFGDLGHILGMLFYTRSFAFSFASGWIQELVDSGPQAHLLFFFNTADTVIFDFFRDLADPLEVTDFINPNDDYKQIEGHFDESGSVAVFDWVTKGSHDYTTPSNIQVEGSERFKIAFDKTTGVMQGYRLEFTSEGTVEGQDFEMQMNQELTLEGYTLPAFYFDAPNGLLPGFTWFISTLAISTLIFTSVIIRKRRSSI